MRCARAAATGAAAGAGAGLCLLLLTLTDGDEAVACRHERSHDAPPAVDPAGRNIFFHETSCAGVGLNTRQACAVESAARAHPDHLVHVGFLSARSARLAASLAAGAPAPPELAPFAAALGYANVRTRHADLARAAADSPLRDWVRTPALARSLYGVSHASDVLRYLTLWRHAGIYLDLDVVVARPLGPLARPAANWAGRESPRAVAAGAIALSGDAVGRRLAAAALRELRASFSYEDWARNGPGVLTRVLRRHCRTRHARLMTPRRCPGFRVYPERVLYPVPWRAWRRYLRARELPAVRNMTARVFHVWNALSAGAPLAKRRRVRYTALAAAHCPRVFAAAPDTF